MMHEWVGWSGPGTSKIFIVSKVWAPYGMKKYAKKKLFTMLRSWDIAVCLHFLGKIQNGLQRSKKGHPSSFLKSFFSKSAVCWSIVTNVNNKMIRLFYTPYIFTFMNCKELKKFGNRKHLKTWPVTLFGPLVAILNFTLKCKQTAVSQKLRMVKIFC